MRISNWKAVVGSICGNAMEWYDFMVFSYMVSLIGPLFFSGADAGAHVILLSTALFGVGFVTRPLGGIVLGGYADRHGTAAAMVLGMGIMALSIALIAFAPTYAQAGSVGVCFLVAGRLLQGFSAGGEFATSTTYLIEAAPPGRRAFYGSWQMMGQLFAQILGGTVGYVITSAFTPGQIAGYAWRIPFLIGLFILPAVLIMRRRTMGQGQPAQHHAAPRLPLAGIMRDMAAQWRAVLSVMGLVSSTSVSLYVLFGYTVTYATQTLHLPMKGAYLVQLSAALGMMLIVPASGWLADRISARRMLFWALFAYFLEIWPLYAWLVAQPSLLRLVVMQVGLAIPTAVFLATYCTIIVTVLTGRHRVTTLATAHNIAVMVVGGLSQFVVTWLLHVTGAAIAPAFFVSVVIAMGTVSALYLVRSEREAPQPSFVPDPIAVRNGK
ncbi:MFS transporter [Komagataeibacter xylinus]|uniref:MFS transporter n=1 Tax=Komagataeibacter xylinus TaxID=28448 RepID=UPI00280AE227|nr:MFS transporter [Komagataeibacter xylinus]